MPSAAPEQDLAQCLEQLALANAVKRKELDWVAHQEAVNKMRQLLHHHADVVMASTKDVISAMLPCTAALRSSTAKVALLFFQVWWHLPCSIQTFARARRVFAQSNRGNVLRW
jgi:hypothetical protein